MKKFLITGASGNIGLQLVNDLHKKNYEIFPCYHNNKLEFENSIYLDLKNEQEIKNIFSTIKPDVVIHLAAITNVDFCESNPNETSTVNVNATKFLAELSEKYNSFFVYVSTDYVFDGVQGSYKETDEPNPINFYGKSKLEGERIVQNINKKWCIARTSTPFGNYNAEKTFPGWIIQELRKGNQLDILQDQFTSPTYIPNLSEMLIEISEKELTTIIHTAGVSRISRYDFALQISKKFDLDESLINPTIMENMNWVATRPKDSSLDVSLASNLLDTKPLEIEASLDLFLNNFSNNC